MGSERDSVVVLIVEDEMLVRLFATDILQDAGYRVEQAADAAEAFKLLDRAPHNLHAAVIDLGLPDISGDQLAQKVRTRHTDLPILIASGRSEKELRERFSSDRRTGILGKPYTAAMLVDALASLGVVASS